MTYKVYWTEAGVPTSKDFNGNEMKQALGHCEAQRCRQNNGEDVNFVSLCSESPDNVTRMGVADVKPGYEWKKRRR